MNDKGVLAALEKLSNKFNERLDSMTGFIVKEFGNIAQRMDLTDMEFRRFRNDTLTSVDKVLGEVIAIRK